MHLWLRNYCYSFAIQLSFKDLVAGGGGGSPLSLRPPLVSTIVSIDLQLAAASLLKPDESYVKVMVIISLQYNKKQEYCY
jgi:hypothetical protein